GSRNRDYAAKTGIDGMGIDQHADMDTAKREWQPLKPLQGNLDPQVLVKGGAEMKQAARKIMDLFGPRHIFNLGHGVVPQTPPEHVKDLVEYVRGYASR
ncbi:MAG: uroporphyrinogen decarboxylase family protein, partial [Bdellovibrionales bacterium]